MRFRRCSPFQRSSAELAEMGETIEPIPIGMSDEHATH
jgi:hypothetical protein